MTQRRIERNPLLILFVAAFFCLVLGYLAGNTTQVFSAPSTSSVCTNPAVRQEWRTLSMKEREEYYRAVKCLATRPSRLGLNGTVYDDFGWIHTTVSKSNWGDLAGSSIWDPVTGFGGDGEKNGEIQVGMGRCVVDGPFKDLRPIFYNGTYHPHCISRGFHDGGKQGVLRGFPCRPEAMGFVMRQDTFKTFVMTLEASLDRLWWKWQQIDPTRRLVDYSDLYETNNTEKASLKDVLRLGGLAEDVTVGDVLDTQGGVLCYKYS
ncbi:hypothetical protein DH86_00003193 [Scytalidium sp. 3C]|nr:hypothetical protein DH86_00003193 [Scytalidium sp. 3C]